MNAGASALLKLLIDQEVLRFGDFTLKSGRQSPYFFNLGALHTGAATQQLAESYAQCMVNSGLSFDLVFGPAYKGIPIAVAVSEALARLGRDVAWGFNRKEEKDHGERGLFVGGSIASRVFLVDDVLTAGTAVRQAVDLISDAGGTLVGVIIAMDRQERGADERTAVQALQEELGVPVLSLLNLQNVIEYLDSSGPGDNYPQDLLKRIRDYQRSHCVLTEGTLR